MKYVKNSIFGPKIYLGWGALPPPPNSHRYEACINYLCGSFGHTT